jgi:hypothetical protein
MEWYRKVNPVTGTKMEETLLKINNVTENLRMSLRTHQQILRDQLGHSRPCVIELGRSRQKRGSKHRTANRFGCAWCMRAKPKSGGMLKSGGRPTRSTHSGSLTSWNVHSIRSSASIVKKPGLNRRETGSAHAGLCKRLEPDEAKVSRPVLRGGSGSNAAPLPDNSTLFPPKSQQKGWRVGIEPTPLSAPKMPMSLARSVSNIIIIGFCRDAFQLPT